MDPLDLPYRNLKILFINIYLILYKAATLNFYKLRLDLEEIGRYLPSGYDVTLLPQQLLILLISLLLMAKLIFGYMSLAANVVAIFPILTDEQPHFLLPSMISQAIENILLSLLEILLGYVTIKFYVPGKMSIFAIFLVKMVVKILLSVSMLNVYADLYNQLKLSVVQQDEDISYLEHKSKEKLLSKHTFINDE